MTNLEPLLFLSSFAVVAVYLATTGYFLNYLKNTHRDTWLELGSPSFNPHDSTSKGFSLGNSSLTLQFLFGSKYRRLNDPKLAKLVWGFRALFFLCLGLMLANAWLIHK